MNTTEITAEQHTATAALAQPAQLVAHDKNTHDVIAQDAAGAVYRITPDGVTTNGFDK